MRVVVFALLLAIAARRAAAFSGPPALRAVRAARSPARTAALEMRLGRSSGFFARIACGAARLPRSGLRDGGAGGGTGGSGGGRGGLARGAGEGEAGEPSQPTPLEAFWLGYLAVLRSRPVITKALTSLVGFAIGDVLAQRCVEKKACFDWKRLLRFASAGMLLHGPMGHWFYGSLDSLIPGASARKVAIKVLIDQTVHAPIFGIVFFSYLAALEGKGPLMAAMRVKHELMTQLTGSWKVWPLAHAVNFAFVPTYQRILYINSIQIGYNMFLSIIGSRGA